MRAGRGGFIVLLAFGLSGCATWVQGTRQDITISTPPTQSAICVVSRKGDHWSVVTPGVLHIDKSIYDLGIHCSRQGFVDANATIPSALETWSLGNLAFGGFPMAIDAADGAMGSYPDEFDLPMTPIRGEHAYAAPPPSRISPPPDDTSPAASEAAPPPSEAPPPEPLPPSSPKPTLPGTLPDNF